MADTIRVKRGNELNLPTLNSGEFGLCLDSEKLFIGGESSNIQIATTEELETSGSLLADKSKQNIGRKKPTSFNTYWTNSISPVATEAAAISQVNSMIDLCDNIVHAQTCGYDADTNTISYYGFMNVIKAGIDHALVNGMSFKCIKFHLGISSIASDIGIENAVTLYYNFIVDYLSNFTDYEIEYIEVLNEDYDGYSNAAYTAGIVSLLTQIKALGFKVSISIRNSYDLYTLYPDIINACDVLMVNLYPIYSVDYKQTTVEHCTSAFDSLMHYFRYLKNTYDKPILVTEFGCNGSWDALEDPATYYTTNRSGVPPYLVIKGLLDSKLINFLDEIWLWYYVDTYQSTQATSLLKSYKNSGNIRG